MLHYANPWHNFFYVKSEISQWLELYKGKKMISAKTALTPSAAGLIIEV